jgi:hypothetical protein
MKKIAVLVLVFATSFGFAQIDQNQENKKWTFGFGINSIDNNSSFNEQFLNSNKNWNNVSSLSKFSVERALGSNFSVDAAITYNRISKEKLQNGIAITNDLNYFALDVNGKFYFDNYISEQSKVDAYVLAGVGIWSADDVSNQSGNLGLGFAFWIQPGLGLRLQTVGKFAADQEQTINNHIQHSVELVFKF